MSEFSRYLLLREDVDVVGAFVARERATALVLQNQHGFTVLASPQHDAFVASDRFLWISYDFASDHGFVLEVHEKGKCVARLEAKSESGRTSKFERSGFVTRTLLSARGSVAINARLEKGDWTHHDIRDLAAREMGFVPVAFLNGGQLLDSRDDLEMRFPEGRLFIDGKRVEREDPLDGVDAILDAEKKAPSSSRGKPKLTRVVMARREMDEIASAFKNSAPLEKAPAAEGVGDVDLAACKNARAWLDARKRVDPARASAAVMLELERVIRDNRFSAEGDIAVVAREAAAILYARCLKAKKRTDAAKHLAAREAEARNTAESSAWSVASKYYAKLDGKAATDD
jgi:hypothetical protein